MAPLGLTSPTRPDKIPQLPLIEWFALVLLCYVLWLVSKTWDTFSNSEKQNPNQSWLARTCLFLRLAQLHVFALKTDNCTVCICCTWLGGVITLVLVYQTQLKSALSQHPSTSIHKIYQRTTSVHVYTNVWFWAPHKVKFHISYLHHQGYTELGAMWFIHNSTGVSAWTCIVTVVASN